MTRPDRDALLRAAGALKMRALRLRALGDADDRWEATALFREAAKHEIAALETLNHPPPDEVTGARVEACGLFLEARDPLRAAEQWSLLPPAAFLEGATAALPAAVKAHYNAGLTGFAAAWCSLLGPLRTCPVATLRADQLRALAEAYPGAPELWWALSRRVTSAGEAELARARALQLAPELARDDVAEAAWAQIEHTLAARLRIDLHAERRGVRLGLDVVSRIAAGFTDLFCDFVEKTAATAVELIPGHATATDGAASFHIDVSAHGSPPFALEDLDAELRGDLGRVAARGLVHLIALLQQHRVKLAVSITLPAQPPALVIDADRRKTLAPAAEAAALRTLDSKDIPQADDIERVFQLVALAAEKSGVTGDPPAITQRQTSYYRRAAKSLGLLSESDELTAAGRLIARLAPADRFRAAVVQFESSICGDAWIRWSKGTTLRDVAPDSAVDFLRASVPGLSKETAERRAQTLTAWYRALIDCHYSR